MLEIITGKSGSGKSNYIYSKIIKESIEKKFDRFFIITPEQYNFETQKKILNLHPKKGFMNIDVISIKRLAFFLLDELGIDSNEIVNDRAKVFIIKKILMDNANNLKVLRFNNNKKEYISAVIDLINQLDIYNTDKDLVNSSFNNKKIDKRLKDKLEDAFLIKDIYKELIKDIYISEEDMYDICIKRMKDSKIFKNATFVFDSFTGFTPIQHKLISSLMDIASNIHIIFTIRQEYDSNKRITHSSIDYLPYSNINKIVEYAKCKNIKVKYYRQYSNSKYKNDDIFKLSEMIFKYDSETVDLINKDSVKVKELASPKEEVKELVDSIKQNIIDGYMYKDIGVVLSDKDRYKRFIEYYFERSDIPYFMDSNYNIMKSEYVNFIMSTINVLNENFSIESVIALIKNPYSPLEDMNAFLLENFIYSRKIRGFKKWNNDFYYLNDSISEDEISELNNYRKIFIDSILPLKENVKKKRILIKDFNELLLNYLSSDFIAEKINKLNNYFNEKKDNYMLGVLQEIYEYTNNVISMYSNILGEYKVTLSEYISILEAALIKTDVGVIPGRFDEINIGDFVRTRFSDIKILYVLGCDDSVFPPKALNGDLITDREKKLLEESNIDFMPSNYVLSNYNNFYIYLLLSKPSEKLVLSYPVEDNNQKVLEISTIIQDILKVIRNLKIQNNRTCFLSYDNILDCLTDKATINSNDTNMFANPIFSSYLKIVKDNKDIFSKYNKYYTAKDNKKINILPKEISDELFKNFKSISISQVRSYIECPMNYFLQKTLKLKERELFEYSSIHSGNILHNALEIVFKKTNTDKKNWGELDEKYIDECLAYAKKHSINDRLSDLLALDSYSDFVVNTNFRDLKYLIKLMNRELGYGSYKPFLFEYEIGNSNIQELSFKLDNRKINILGKIDRVDLYSADNFRFFKIIDYKLSSSEAKTFSLSSIYAGLSLQLPIYSYLLNKIFENSVTDIMTNMPITIKVEKNKSKENAVVMEDYIKKYNSNSIYRNPSQIWKNICNDLIDISSISNVKFNQNGTLNKKCESISYQDDEISLIEEYALIKVKNICKNIIRGNIEIKPFDKKGNNNLDDFKCRYCKYNDICKFNIKDKSFKINKLNFGKVDKDIILSEMKKDIIKYGKAN